VKEEVKDREHKQDEEEVEMGREEEREKKEGGGKREQVCIQFKQRIVHQKKRMDELEGAHVETDMTACTGIAASAAR
jgi:hypothetical protein